MSTLSPTSLIESHLEALDRIAKYRLRLTPPMTCPAKASLFRRLLHAALSTELALRRALANRLAEAIVRNDLGTAARIWDHLCPEHTPTACVEPHSGPIGTPQATTLPSLRPEAPILPRM